MHITHHGAFDGVTGSCHQLHLSDTRSLLIDCGLFQGADRKGHEEPEIDFPLDGIQALILTHVHIDHVGRIPYLLDAGFRGPIYCSRPTARLLPLMLEDAMRLSITRKKKLIQEFIEELRTRVRPLPYDKWEKIEGGVRMRLRQAGHVLGSAYVEFDHGDERIVFSGDLGSRLTPLLKDPISPERADMLVLESTYGDRNHEGREERIQHLEAILCHTLENKGVTIIPAFSLGRTQELLYEMNQILENIEHRTLCPLLKAVDVIVDSPLANRLTKIYEQMREFWDEEAHAVLSVDSQPLVFENLVQIDKHNEHLDTIRHLRDRNLPAIVIAGSGMCTGGRVVDYLKEFVGDPKADILFVGYQAAGTPGRYIQSQSEWVRLDGKPYPIQARIHTLTGYSAHADQSDLLKFVQGIPVPPKEIRLVHGETQAKTVLNAKLSELGYHVS